MQIHPHTSTTARCANSFHERDVLRSSFMAKWEKHTKSWIIPITALPGVMERFPNTAVCEALTAQIVAINEKRARNLLATLRAANVQVIDLGDKFELTGPERPASQMTNLMRQTDVDRLAHRFAEMSEDGSGNFRRAFPDLERRVNEMADVIRSLTDEALVEQPHDGDTVFVERGVATGLMDGAHWEGLG